MHNESTGACKRYSGAATDAQMLLAGGLRAAVHTQRVATPLMMARMFELPAEGTYGASFAIENPVNLNPALSVVLQSPLDLLTAAADGDIAASLEAIVLLVAGVFAVAAARSLVSADAADAADAADEAPRQPRTVDPAEESFAVDIDLGEDGEPPGVSRLAFQPLLARSDLLQLQLRVPLGLLIEERRLTDVVGAAAASAAGSKRPASTILVTGALPGTFGAFGAVAEGDLVRGVTAYTQVVGNAPMWQQVTSGTPVGKAALKRLVFRADGATYADIRDAIASHRDGDGVVTLLVERAVDAARPLAPRDTSERGGLEPLQSVLARDLKLPAMGGEDVLDGLPAVERAKRLLGVEKEDT